MIEMMGVLLLVAILGSLAVTQFLDQRHEARVAAMEQIRQSVKMGLSLQHKNTLLRCNNAASLKIPYDSFIANDVTTGASPLCTVDQVPNASERKIYDSSGSFSFQNQMNGLTTVGFAPALGSGQSYIQSECSTSSSGNAYGWCYTEDGDFFAADDETRTIASSGEGASSSAASSEPCNGVAPLCSCSLDGNTTLTCALPDTCGIAETNGYIFNNCGSASSSDSSTCGTELYYEWYNGESCSCRYQAWDTCLNMATGGGYVESDPSSCTSYVGVCPSAVSSSSSSSSSSECPMGQMATTCDGGATYICTADPGSACVSSSSSEASSASCSSYNYYEIHSGSGFCYQHYPDPGNGCVDMTANANCGECGMLPTSEIGVCYAPSSEASSSEAASSEQ